jgi:hypothetical protein
VQSNIKGKHQKEGNTQQNQSFVVVNSRSIRFVARALNERTEAYRRLICWLIVNGEGAQTKII